MDRTAHYHELIVRAIEGTNHYRFPPKENDVETLFICDEKKHQYMLYIAGWSGQKPINNVVIASRIKEGKIWIYEDWTEEGIATDLLRWGVPPTDIVLAFHPPSLRDDPEPLLYA